ncbi:EAL domain-containing protein [Pararhizobium arenae]|uniref:EAL domain-containing protein n=1 Tax=Pararhizobium arenae TaxID=1856850 RepID=UPI0024780526|nr:EAL domain-containing protein [Pararhizobium arenae]
MEKDIRFSWAGRWQRDDKSFAPPDRFIQVAEETGLITALCEHLLRQACTDASGWPDGLILSFNLSPIQIEDRLLVSRIGRILQETGLPSSRLEIEITENALIGDPDRAANVIEQLHAVGIQVALDDFGTGYSSLSQLARFQFDKIKIDKSFVSGSAANQKNEKIIDAIMGLGRSLNLKITVEGIEENKQLAYFMGHGCDVGQGYLLGKAMPSFEVLSFLDAYSQALKA